jgi:antitoxin (DNA-binding transcriptional repressor) of toxin-antitoxin stability system
MEHRITASLLARRLGDVLSRVRYRGETFLVERHNVTIARIEPTDDQPQAALADAARAWMAGHDSDPSFADDIERVSAADRPTKKLVGLVVEL